LLAVHSGRWDIPVSFVIFAHRWVDEAANS
jgi:hypothetical protein